MSPLRPEACDVRRCLRRAGARQIENFDGRLQVFEDAARSVVREGDAQNVVASEHGLPRMAESQRVQRPVVVLGKAADKSSNNHPSAVGISYGAEFRARRTCDGLRAVPTRNHEPSNMQQASPPRRRDRMRNPDQPGTAAEGGAHYLVLLARSLLDGMAWTQ